MLVFKILKLLKSRMGVFLILTVVVLGILILKKRINEGNNPSSEKANYTYVEPVKKPLEEKTITTLKRNTANLETTRATVPQLISNYMCREPLIENIQTENDIADDKKAKSELPIVLNLYTKVKESTISEHIQAENQKGLKEKESVPEKFAPFGRLIKCELVNTIDSFNIQTPIIGLVMEDVFWNGALIIPAGSEIHGIARTDRVRERITSGNTWNIVLPEREEYPNGMVLKINGVALDRSDPTGQGQTFGIDDGSFGLKGIRLKNDNMEEIELFVATFMGAFTAGLQEQIPSGNPFGGNKTNNTSRNATLGGLSSVMEQYAQTLKKEIEINGFYTRVPAGKQFYLYVQQTIDSEDWGLGHSLAEKENTQGELSIKDIMNEFKGHYL